MSGIQYLFLFLKQLKASSEEDDTKNAEFPDGRFILLSAGTRYKVCGDEDTPGNESDRMETPPSRSLVMGPGGLGHWSIPPSWQQQGPGPSSKRQKTMPYESFLKHSFPCVSLCWMCLAKMFVWIQLFTMYMSKFRIALCLYKAY